MLPWCKPLHTIHLRYRAFCMDQQSTGRTSGCHLAVWQARQALYPAAGRHVCEVGCTHSSTIHGMYEAEYGLAWLQQLYICSSYAYLRQATIEYVKCNRLLFEVKQMLIVHDFARISDVPECRAVYKPVPNAAFGVALHVILVRHVAMHCIPKECTLAFLRPCMLL